MQRLERSALRGRSRMRNAINVIASEAKQSTLSLRGKMDCFAALAMTFVLANDGRTGASHFQRIGSFN
jgi:hypothetical protein